LDCVMLADSMKTLKYQMHVSGNNNNNLLISFLFLHGLFFFFFVF
jgi:hypothetical protein